MLEDIKTKFTLRAFVAVTGWIGLLASIAYGFYKFPEQLEANLSTLIGVALTIVNIAIAKWLFEAK